MSTCGLRSQRTRRRWPRSSTASHRIHDTAGFLHAVVPEAAAGRLLDHAAGVVAVSRQGRIVGHACFVTWTAGRADVAVAVLDRWQRRGIGTRLPGRLGELAAARGVQTFTATLSDRNRRLVDALREAGVPVQVRRGDHPLLVQMPADPHRLPRIRGLHGWHGLSA